MFAGGTAADIECSAEHTEVEHDAVCRRAFAIAATLKVTTSASMQKLLQHMLSGRAFLRRGAWSTVHFRVDGGQR